MKKKKILVWVVVFFVCFFILIFISFSYLLFLQKGKSPSLYEQGLQYYFNNDYQNAYYNFSRIYPISDLYLNALFYQAKCADLLDDKNTAIKKYSRLSGLIKDENFTPFLYWRMGKLSSDKNAAKKIFLKLNKVYPASQYGIAANFELAKLTLDADKKRDYLLDYVKYSPKGRYINDVLLEILSSDFELNDAQKVVFANGLYENAAYNRAITILKDVPIELQWPLLIKSLDKINSKNNILKVAQKGIIIDNSHFDEDALLDAIAIYAKNMSGDYTAALENIYLKSTDKRIKAAALYKLIQNLPSYDANKLYSKFYENYPESKFAPDVLYRLFITALLNNKTPLALKYGKTYISLYKNDNTPAVLYFVSFLKKKIADSGYLENAQSIIRDYQSSYWAYLAYKNLLNKDLTFKHGAAIMPMGEIPFPIVQDKKIASFVKNFIDYGDFTPFDDFRIDNLLIKSWIEYKRGNRALSSVYARDYIKKSSSEIKRENVAWKLAYPIYYEDKINEFAKRRNLDPYLILSLIKEESHFNPNIVSSAGAAGLMQIMPLTANMIAKRELNLAELKNVENNINLGTKYFAELMQIFSNNEALSVLSYNSGPNAVKKWIKDNPSAQFDIFVENIPYSETRNYIKKVYGSLWNYLLTYGMIKL